MQITNTKVETQTLKWSRKISSGCRNRVWYISSILWLWTEHHFGGLLHQNNYAHHLKVTWCEDALVNSTIWRNAEESNASDDSLQGQTTIKVKNDSRCATGINIRTRRMECYVRSTSEYGDKSGKLLIGFLEDYYQETYRWFKLNCEWCENGRSELDRLQNRNIDRTPKRIDTITPLLVLEARGKSVPSLKYVDVTVDSFMDWPHIRKVHSSLGCDHSNSYSAIRNKIYAESVGIQSQLARTRCREQWQ